MSSKTSHAPSSQMGAEDRGYSQSQMSSVAGGRLNNKATPSLVKALHDSCYVSPSKNYRVIKDSDPVKSAAMSEATRRYEEMVNQRKHDNTDHIN